MNKFNIPIILSNTYEFINSIEPIDTNYNYIRKHKFKYWNYNTIHRSINYNLFGIRLDIFPDK